MLDDLGLQTPVGLTHESAVKGFGGPLFKLSFHIRVIAEIADVINEIKHHEDFFAMAQCVDGPLGLAVLESMFLEPIVDLLGEEFSTWNHAVETFEELERMSKEMGMFWK